MSSLAALPRDQFRAPVEKAYNKWTAFAAKRQQPKEGGEKRKLRKIATKKLAVLSNAGRVENHHCLKHVRRNSAIIAAAKEKMKAWETKKMAIKLDVDILRYQNESEARKRRVSNVSEIGIQQLKADSKFYAEKIDSMKGLIHTIRHKTRAKERYSRDIRGRNTRRKKWLSIIFSVKVTNLMGSKLFRLSIASVMLFRRLKAAMARKSVRVFMRTAFPLRDTQNMLKTTFRLACMRLKHAVYVIQKAVRTFMDTRKSQCMMMRLMKLVVSRLQV
jgi:hypothetical protein